MWKPTPNSQLSSPRTTRGKSPRDRGSGQSPEQKTLFTTRTPAAPSTTQDPRPEPCAAGCSPQATAFPSGSVRGGKVAEAWGPEDAATGPEPRAFRRPHRGSAGSRA